MSLVAEPAAAKDLAVMGFDVVSRANNHSMDWGVEGMRETTRVLDEAGLVHAGVGENRGDARSGALPRDAARTGRAGLDGVHARAGPSPRCRRAAGRPAGPDCRPCA